MATSCLQKVSICCYNVCVCLQKTVGVEGTPGWVRRYDVVLATQSKTTRCTCHTSFSASISGYPESTKERVGRPRYVVHSVSAHCGHTVFVKFRY